VFTSVRACVIIGMIFGVCICVACLSDVACSGGCRMRLDVEESVRCVMGWSDFVV